MKVAGRTGGKVAIPAGRPRGVAGDGTIHLLRQRGDLSRIVVRCGSGGSVRRTTPPRAGAKRAACSLWRTNRRTSATAWVWVARKPQHAADDKGAPLGVGRQQPAKVEGRQQAAAQRAQHLPNLGQHQLTDTSRGVLPPRPALLCHFTRCAPGPWFRLGKWLGPHRPPLCFLHLKPIYGGFPNFGHAAGGVVSGNYSGPLDLDCGPN